MVLVAFELNRFRVPQFQTKLSDRWPDAAKSNSLAWCRNSLFSSRGNPCGNHSYRLSMKWKNMSIPAHSILFTITYLFYVYLTVLAWSLDAFTNSKCCTDIAVFLSWSHLISGSCKHLLVQDMSSSCTGLTLNVCLSYGGRSDVVRACRGIAEKVQSGELPNGNVFFRACVLCGGFNMF